MAIGATNAKDLCGDTSTAAYHDDLVRRLQSGHSDAWSEVDIQFSKYLVNFLKSRYSVSHQDAEDFVQETFIKAFTQIHNFKNESNLRTWLTTIATNLMRDKNRSPRAKMQTSSFNDEMEERPADIAAKPESETPANRFNTKESFGIPEELWQIYQLKEQGHRSWERVMEVTGLSREEVERKYNQASQLVERLRLKGEAFAKAMEGLEAKEKEIISLVEIQQFPIELAARNMELPLEEAILLLSRARAKIFLHLFGPRWDRHFIDFVPAHFTEPITLSELEGLTDVQIAETLQIPLGTVKTRINRARQAIRFLKEGMPRYIDSLYQENQRTIARLYFIDGYSPTEIADILGKPLARIQESLGGIRRHILTLYERQTQRDEEMRASIPILLREREQRNYQLVLPETATEIKTERLDALKEKGWTEEKIREVAKDFDERDQKIIELVFFQGMTVREVELHAGIPANDVTQRAYRLSQIYNGYEPNNLPPRLMRGPYWEALAPAIHWGEAVTDPQKVPAVVENLIAQLIPGPVQDTARLVYVDGLTVEQAAEKQGRTVRDVTRWLFHARQRIEPLRYAPGLPEQLASQKLAEARVRDQNILDAEVAEREKKAEMERLIAERISPELQPLARAYFVDGMSLRDSQKEFGIGEWTAKQRRKEIRDALGIPNQSSNANWIQGRATTP